MLRGIGHIVLTECYFVPLSVLLCFWIYERKDILVFNKSFFKNPRNYFVILFCILIANNGIAYYPFFTCYMLIVTALVKFFRDKDKKAVLKSIFAIVGICIFVVLSILPGVIYKLSQGNNGEAVVRSGFMETEYYGLKIIQLFIPNSSHGNALVERIINKYSTGTFWLNENVTSYIGILGIIGFI
ncbi:MAG: hypothetical protein Q4F11_09130, partial [Eubacteriales bacterium]|nr:hypothetical protein [Eubacteriales bacterium]